MSFNKFYQSASIDPEQKDLVISQLRTEILEIKQTELKFEDEFKQLQKLDNLYYVLQEEKLRVETENRGKLEYTLHTIANLKTDIDTLKHNSGQSGIENQKLRSENFALKEISENKALVIEDLKKELTDALDLNNQLREEIRIMDNQIGNNRDEKRGMIGQGDKLDKNISELRAITIMQEKNIQDLEYDKTRREKQIVATQQVLDNLGSDHKSKHENLVSLDAQNIEANRNINFLDNEHKDHQKNNEKTKSESLAHQKAHQNEVSKNLDVSAKIIGQENTLRIKDSQIADLKTELDVLKRAHATALDTNFHLHQELDHVHQQNDTMENQNHELVAELDKFSKQDQQLIELLNRKGRVEELKNKAGSHASNSWNTIDRVKNSPSRKGRQAGESPTRTFA